MKRILILLAAILVIGVGVLFYLGHREDDTGSTASSAPIQGDAFARGAYLVRAGNCMGCHTARGGGSYAGGRAVQTPFGAVYSTNLTPDAQTGLGNWTPDDFWRALHNGKSRDGRLLYPAFPYPNYTRVSREDADAMFAFLRSIEPVKQENRQPDLRFPYNQRPLLAVWRALYFQPGVYQPDTAQNAEWNRGAYLVQGLGHCNACHSPRSALGGTRQKTDLAGALLPAQDWYAPSLLSPAEAGMADWPVQEIASLLHSGIAPRAVTSGPMADVVRGSLQYLDDKDIRAMSVYLKALPQAASAPSRKADTGGPENAAILANGAALYEKHCAECHGANGAGKPPGIPALAGNRSVVQEPAVNAIRAVLHGGYPPSTKDNPQPFGMPPFGNFLSDIEVAAAVSYIRTSWGNSGDLVSAPEVARHRAVNLD
ncbi:Cytochrome c, mono- and diheme variants [Noviherbaspirillum humi]|uniref:Cytochrome c, mono- and diheme variants n=1 Tax=Noviherbaspirillum humi TaxID=1688639 RepID=A0A239HDF5_9BURK|nr:cytochrome c [Noviherbaspirillum humi]SNS79181.1 Cytochrome c, mono- and diheme variants [Noviherbaspirillum humi]